MIGREQINEEVVKPFFNKLINELNQTLQEMQKLAQEFIDQRPQRAPTIQPTQHQC